ALTAVLQYIFNSDVAVLDYRAPSLAANSISTHFSGDREAAVVLDVACGTGLVAQQVNLQDQKELQQAAQGSSSLLLTDGLSSLPAGLFDVVVIVGALSVGQVPVDVVRELFKSTKPGGYICMTTRSNHDNLQYKASLERELKQMEEEELWTCVEYSQVEDWERAVSEQEHGYISGAVYIYKKL
uniref:Methyltransferase like 27 n=1 Tax=Sparus aurata TaxID=8175 RepID=A0A671TML6_SPAAU